MVKKFAGVVFVFIFLLAVFSSPLRAQQDVSALTGVVSDKSDAVVADASVKIVDTRTGATLETKTAADGSYHFPRLQPGPGYTLTVHKDGFETFTISSLYLAVAATRTQNVHLEIGNVSQVVEVTSEGSVSLNTTDSTIGNNFDMRAVESLPNEFRDDPANLLRLQPGVVSAQSSDNNLSSDPSGSRDGAVAGARADQDNITVDGIDATSFTTGASFATQAAIPVDAVQEFSTQVGDPTAAFGGRSGAQTIIATKSGTNAFHGSASEFNRTAATEANTFFNNKAGVPRNNLVRNQFGANIGGPIRKDKLFFFFDYEGRRDAQQINESQLVPFPHVDNGSIAYINANSTVTGKPCSPNSQLTSADVSTDCVTILSPAQVAAFDPCSQAGGCPNAPGFTAPGAAPALLNLFKSRYPAPNDFSLGDGVNTAGFRFNAPNPLTENTIVTRVDYNLSAKHKLFGRFNFRHLDAIITPIQFPGDPLTGPAILRDTAYVIGETWTVSPNTVNQLTVGETRTNLNDPNMFNPSGSLVELSFFGSALSSPFARQTSAGSISPVPTFRDDVTRLHGKHSFQFGVEWQPIKVRSTLTNNFNFIQEGLGGSINSLPSNLRPANILTSSVLDPSTGLPVDPHGAAAANWDNFFVADLGIINNVQSAISYTKNGDIIPQGQELHRRDYRFNQYAGYFQDAWKARSDLTITLGVRYQFDSVPYEVNGLQASFVNTDLSQILTARAQNGLNGISGPDATPNLIYQLTGKGNPGTPDLYSPDTHNFSPRLALAWNPSVRDGFLNKILGDRKTVFRASASLIYDQTVINAVTNLEDQSNYVYGNTVAANFGGGGPVASLQSDPRFTSQNSLPFPINVPPFQTPVTPNAIFNDGVDNKLHTPYSETFSIGVQRELPGGFQLEIDYFSRYGRRLFALTDAAQVVNFTDPASKHTFAGDSTILEQEARQNVSLNNVAPLPFFENQVNAGLPAATGVPGATCESILGISCTQFVYANNLLALQQGNIGNVALGIFGLVPPNVLIPSQFFVNAIGSNKGYSSYNAMFATLRKRLSRNLQFDFNYTYSHSIDNISAIANNNGNFIGGSTQVLCDAYNTNACKGNSEFDATHQVTADFVYDLPVGRNQWIARNASHWLNEVIGGWQVSGIVSWRTGLALDAVGGGSTTSLAADDGTIFSGSTSAIASGIHTDTANNNEIQFFANPAKALAAFGPVTGLEVGSRDTLRGPRFSNTDLGVSKIFPIYGEKYKLQFRADAFNVFNHPNFGFPNTNVTTSTFGVITSQVGQEPARVMQFALRFQF
jgi:hypothetical protein